MSYELYFEAGHGKSLDKKTFAAHFKKRKNYQAGKGQALYQNEDTGVYFIFDEPGADGIAAMNLNLFRPHTFGLEAAMEIEALVAAFAASVVDPQQDAEGPQPFAREKFLRAYNDANRFAYKSMIGEQGSEQGPIHTWPTKRIREVWHWNFTRPDEKAQEREGYFVPGIFAAQIDGRLASLAIWPPQCAIVLPRIDAVMVPLAQTGKGAQGVALVPWAEIEPVVADYHESASSASGIARYRVNNEPDWPAEIATFLNTKRQPAKKIEGVAMDEVLDREVVEAARKG
jgi:hypothetical protein